MFAHIFLFESSNLECHIRRGGITPRELLHASLAAMDHPAPIQPVMKKSKSKTRWTAEEVSESGCMCPPASCIALTEGVLDRTLCSAML